MKKLLLVPLILLLLLFISCAKEKSGEMGSGDAAMETENVDITIVTEEYPPYNYTEDGKVVGLSTEIVEEVFKRAKISYSLKSYPWARAYKMAQEQKNVLIYSIGRNEAREKLFKWVDVIVPYNIYLYKLKKNKKVKVNSLNDAKKYKVGGVKDDVRAQYLEKEGFTIDKNLMIVNNDTLNIRKLFGGRIDMFPIDELGCAVLAKQSDSNYSEMEKAFFVKGLSSGLYMAFSKITEDSYVNKCKEVLQKMKDDGSYYKIKDKYLKD